MSPAPQATVSQTVCDRCEALWDELHAPRFIQEMAAGTLPERKFGFYLGQNILYLHDFARVCALGAAKARDEAAMTQFAALLQGILQQELPHNRALFAKAQAADPSVRAPERMAPATLAYTRFLLSVAYEGGTPEILAAIMPCVWSYGLIGKDNVAQLSDHPIYRDWFEFFAGQTYWDGLNALKELFDRVCTPVFAPELDRLTEIFATGSRLERAFWTMAYNEEDWS